MSLTLAFELDLDFYLDLPKVMELLADGPKVGAIVTDLVMMHLNMKPPVGTVYFKVSVHSS